MIDLKAVPDTELEQLRRDVMAEQERRTIVETAPVKADELASAYRQATGMQDGDPWVQPTGAHGAYPEGWTVTHNGKTWVSLTPACVWEPGVSGWREVVEEGSGPAEWVAPTGAHDDYGIGDQVTFEGSIFESAVDGNTWSPTDYPAGWTLIGPVP